MSTNNIRKRGRPKGNPTVKRSIALDKELNDYLIKKHNQTMIPYNALINMAVAQMKENEGKK